MDFSISKTIGGVEGTGEVINLSYKPTNLNFIFQYSLSNVDIDKILELSVFGIDSKSVALQLGYLIIENDNLHLMQCITKGSKDFSFLNYGVEVDTTSVGFLLRALASEITVLNFGFEYVEYDNLSIPSLTRTALNNELSNRGYGTFTDSDYDSIENNSISSSNILITLNLETHITENLLIKYGFATDFELHTISLAGGFKF